MDTQQIWMRKTDAEVLAAAEKLHEYTEEGDRTIRAELLRRGLPESAPPVGSCDACGRSIPASHPITTCLQCDERLSADTLRRLEDARRTIEPRIIEREPVQGIAGWLIIPALGLVLAPIMSGAMLFLGWNLVQTAAPEYSEDPRFWVVMLLDAAMILFTVVVACHFFRKRRVAVPLIVALLVASVVVSACQVGLNAWMFGAEGGDLSSVIRRLVYALIWVPYFKTSKRVSNTFTAA